MHDKYKQNGPYVAQMGKKYIFRLTVPKLIG